MSLLMFWALSSIALVFAFLALFTDVLKRLSRNGTPNLAPMSRDKMLSHIQELKNTHEVAAVFADLVEKDGAGYWPPRANHNNSTWPEALRPYKDIYFELAHLIPQETVSLDDEANEIRISDFRARFRKLLNDKVNLEQVRLMMQAAEAGRWDLFPRDVYNAFYCCIASSRHAFRWATIPVVRVAQLEKEVDLPAELVEPWTYLQRHFGCASDSGNNTSNLVLNFDPNGNHVYRINTGMSEKITSGEEAFARIFHDVELAGLPIYHDMVLATIAFARDDKAACAQYLARITAQLRFVLSSYYDRMHDGQIPLSVWLSRVQGFFAWGVGHFDQTSGEWVRFDGLSGNQIPLFQALDAFLGLEPYLPLQDRERNVPVRQRVLANTLSKYSFRAQLSALPQDETVTQIIAEFDEIVKRIRLFRTAHRSRAKNYLSQPAPERLPMTAGKSLLRTDLDQSLEFLDQFMVKRLAETK